MRAKEGSSLAWDGRIKPDHDEKGGRLRLVAAGREYTVMVGFNPTISGDLGHLYKINRLRSPFCASGATFSFT